MLLFFAGSASAALVYQQPATGAIVAARDDGSQPRVIAHGSAPAVSGDGRRVVYLSSGSLRLVATTGGRSRLLLRHAVARAVWSPDHRHLLAGVRSGAWLIDIVKHRRRLIPLSGSFAGASFSYDGLLALVDAKRYVAESRLGTKTVQRLPGRGLPVWGKGGLAYAHGDQVLLRKRLDGKARVLATGSQPLRPIAWSGDGKRLLVARGGQAELAEVKTGAVLTLPLTFSAIEGLSRDGTHILGEMNGDVVSVDFAGKVQVLARGATSPSWNAGPGAEGRTAD